MTVKTRWWWIRHAPVDNPDHRLYGQSDVEAVISGPDPYQRLSQILPADAVWVSSHLSRTRDTAAALRPHMEARGHQTPNLIEFTELAEQDFGTWQGKNVLELKAMLGDEFEKVRLTPAEILPPGGESFADVITRVTDTVARLTRQHQGRDIIAFAHGGSIRAALAAALKLAPGAALSFQIRNLSLTRIDHVIPGDEPPRGSALPWQVHEVNHLHPEDH
jgi:broad specificity phosphatase PhoE